MSLTAVHLWAGMPAVGPGQAKRVGTGRGESSLPARVVSKQLCVPFSFCSLCVLPWHAWPSRWAAGRGPGDRTGDSPERKPRLLWVVNQQV